MNKSLNKKIKEFRKKHWLLIYYYTIKFEFKYRWYKLTNKIIKTLEKFEDWVDDKLRLDNIYWFFWRWYQRLIVDLFYTIKYSIQKLIRGYADYEVWNLNTNISHFIYPRLKALVKIKNSYPSKLTFDKWNNILNKILFAIEEDVNGCKNKPTCDCIRCTWVHNNISDWDKNPYSRENEIHKKYLYDIKKYHKRLQEGHRLLGVWYRDLWD